MNSSDGGDSGVSVFKSPVLPLTSMNVAVRHTATPTIDILDTPRARRENRGDVKLDVDPFQKQVWSAGHLGVGHSPQPGVVKMGDSAGAWATHAFSLGGRDGRDASGGGGKGDVDDKWAVGGQRVRELSLVVEEGHEAQVRRGERSEAKRGGASEAKRGEHRRRRSLVRRASARERSGRKRGGLLAHRSRKKGKVLARDGSSLSSARARA
jgi:hypothetical protein